jgi:hypothetical protein
MGTLIRYFEKSWRCRRRKCSGCAGFIHVGGLRSLREQQRVGGAEAEGLRLKSRHTSVITKGYFFAYRADALNLSAASGHDRA